MGHRAHGGVTWKKCFYAIRLINSMILLINGYNISKKTPNTHHHCGYQGLAM